MIPSIVASLFLHIFLVTIIYTTILYNKLYASYYSIALEIATAYWIHSSSLHSIVLKNMCAVTGNRDHEDWKIREYLLRSLIQATIQMQIMHGTARCSAHNMYAVFDF